MAKPRRPRASASWSRVGVESHGRESRLPPSGSVTDLRRPRRLIRIGTETVKRLRTRNYYAIRVNRFVIRNDDATYRPCPRAPIAVRTTPDPLIDRVCCPLPLHHQFNKINRSRLTFFFSNSYVFAGVHAGAHLELIYLDRPNHPIRVSTELLPGHAFHTGRGHNNWYLIQSSRDASSASNLRRTRCGEPLCRAMRS